MVYVDRIDLPEEVDVEPGQEAIEGFSNTGLTKPTN